MLNIKNITKTFNAGTVNAKTAIKDLSLNVNKGDFIMLANYNPSVIINGILVFSVGIVVVRVCSIASALINCLGESRQKKND